MRKVLSLLALAVLAAACTKPRPPKPPEPPVEPPGGLPAVGVPVSPERLLRPGPNATVTLGGQRWDAFMAVQCCMPAPAAVGNSRWPMASESWMDYTRAYSANMWHLRMGPFYGTADVESDWVDVGSPYQPGTLEWNPAFWKKVRELAWHAHELGPDTQLEVVVIDTWGCKVAQQGTKYMPWPQADIDACGRRMTPVQRDWIRKVVQELGCFGHVVWSTDNEGGNIPSKQAQWWADVVAEIRAAERELGCGFVHMVGTNSGIPEVESAVDFVAVHARNALSAPKAGRWTINNERNPNFPPDVEVANFETARRLGLAWAFWRSEMTEAEMAQTLEGMKRVASGGSQPPPTGPGCFAPDPDDLRWAQTPVQRPCQRCQEVDAAKAAIGSRCGQNVQQSLALLAEELRRRGLCASGPWVDAVAVQGTDGLWEEHHAIAYTDGCWTTTARGYKGAWKFDGPAEQPGPGPTGCSNPVTPKVERWVVKQHNRLIDATPQFYNGATYRWDGFEISGYCEAAGMPGRARCPARSECPGFKCEERSACEAIGVGGQPGAVPIWRCDGGPASVTENPYQARCPEGSTWAEVCTTDMKVCGRLNL